jgi:arsenite methyltransferase
MTQHDEIRRQVSKNYARAVTTGKGCCGNAASAPQPTPSTLAGYRPDEVADLPADAVQSSFGCGNPVAFSEIRPGEVVLDLGSGAGIDLLLAAKKVGPTGRVIGVDMTDEMIDRARQNIAAAGLDNVEVRKGVIEELPVEPSSVDWVISNCVINLSPEKGRVFREIARVLKPGGRMRVSDIVVEELPDWARQSASLYSACIGGAISEASYLEGLRAAGLCDVEVSERLIYGADELRALAPSELSAIAPAELGACACCGGGAPVDDQVVAQVAGELAGKIWSARIHARKPGP